MPRRVLRALGVLLLVAGAVALAHPRWMISSAWHEQEIGATKIITETRNYRTVPAAGGIALLVAGAGLIALGARRRS